MEIPFETPVVCPVVIGRTTELTGLRSLLERVKSGVGQVMVLSGEAGIGKSRLVAETKAVARAEGFLVLQGSCFPTDRSCPYAPLLDLLRSFLATDARARIIAELGPLTAAFFPLLPDLLPQPSGHPLLPPLDAEQEKRRLFAGLTHVFTSQTDTSPLLLVIEDLHWSDDTSLEFLHYLARRCASHQFLLLLTYRSEEVHPGLQHLLAQLDRERLAWEYVLARLTRSEVEAMLHAIFAEQRVLPGELREMLSTLTDGNPFFIEEVLKSLLTSGGITFTDSGWMRLLLSAAPDGHLSIPRSVQDAVSQRTRRLSPQAKQLLMLAAVAGRRFDVSVLQRLLRCNASQLVGLLQEVVAAQLVVEESADRFSFRHALTRQAIYAGLLARERRALHRRVASAIELLFASPTALDAHLADLAYHCFQGEEWEKAQEYGQRAGEKALALFTPRAAVEHLTRAVEAASHLSAPPPSSLYRTRGQAYELLVEFERARADYEQVLALAQEAQETFLEWQGLSDLGFLWASRDYSQAGQWFHRALDLAQALADPRLQANSLNRLGNWLVNTGHVAEGIQAHQQALQMFETQQDTRGMAETFDLLGTANCLSGDLVTAVKLSGQAIELFRAAGDISSLASSLSMRAGYSLSETTFSPLRARDECVQEAAEALRLSRQTASPGAEAFAELILGHVLAPFGEFGSALAHAQEACRIATEIGHRQWTAGAYCVLGATYLLQLEPTFARDVLETGLALSRELGSTWWIIQTTIPLTRVYLLKNELERAEAALAAMLSREQRPRDLGERSVRLVWGELALAQGQPDMALQIAQELLQTVPGAANLPGGQPIPQLLKLQGEALIALGRAEEAIQVLKEAKRGTAERYEHARLWYMHGLLGRVYRLAGQEKLARQELLAARTIIASLAATIDEPALREQFTQAALATFWPGEKPRPDHLLEAAQYNGLTLREREVAALIAQGQTNGEIAQALGVTKRTVETHIGNILDKLGFSSRAQVIVWAIERGLTKR
jgi:DNA-binding CsgD family transcriptional regulator